MKTRSLLLACSAFAFLANGPMSASCDNTDWVRIDPAQERQSVNYQWVVSLSDGKAVANYAKPQRDVVEPSFEADMTSVLDPQFVPLAYPGYFKVADGWLVFADHGEFGGGLKWYAESGDRDYDIAKGLNIAGCFRHDDAVYVFGGLSHLGQPDGFVREVKNEAGRWVLGDGVALPSPVQFLQATSRSVLRGQSDDELWVVCDQLIARYQTAKNQLNCLYGKIGFYDDTHCRWEPYQANSIVETRPGKFFIGTRIGVLRIEHGYEVWLKPKHAEETAAPPDALYAPPLGPPDPFAVDQ
ncbi:MAG: hypothetical protein ABII82_09315 [Verrucomicrobiota bacterium]